MCFFDAERAPTLPRTCKVCRAPAWPQQRLARLIPPHLLRQNDLLLVLMPVAQSLTPASPDCAGAVTVRIIKACAALTSDGKHRQHERAPALLAASASSQLRRSPYLSRTRERCPRQLPLLPLAMPVACACMCIRARVCIRSTWHVCTHCPSRPRPPPLALATIGKSAAGACPPHRQLLDLAVANGGGCRC